jgi:hypothetical protein
MVKQDKHEASLRHEFLQLQSELQNPDVFGRTDYPSAKANSQKF